MRKPPHGASMGPRSVERGNQKTGSLYFGNDELQWGRVRLNAETSVIGSPSPSLHALQWGRVRLNAETSSWSATLVYRPVSFNGAAFG